MIKSPNWLSEELMLALELYLAKDLTWLSKISDRTPEIVTLSYILQNLDYHKSPRPEKFRSVGSVRMKLSNFKAIDPQYGKTSLSNIGQTDRDVWKKYSASYSDLKKACKEIIDKHYVGEHREDVKNYYSRLCSDIDDNKLIDFKKTRSEVILLVNTFRNICQISNEEELVKACEDFLVHLQKSKKTLLFDEKPYVEHGGINLERIQSEDKVGIYVRKEMARLISENRISKEVFEQLKSKEWCKTVFHISHPLIKEIDSTIPVKPQLRDKNGYLRYWKTIYRLDNREFVICKEWFESNKKYFTAWVSSLISIPDESPTDPVFIDILKYIQVVDSKEVNVSVAEIKKRFSEYDKTEEVIEFLLENGVLSPYQGSLRELVIDDYEQLYEMLKHPENYLIKD